MQRLPATGASITYITSYSNQWPAGEKHIWDSHGSKDIDVNIGASQYTLIQYFYCIYIKLVTCRGCANCRMCACDLWASSAEMFITLWALINWRSALNGAGVSACWWRELQYWPRHMQISLRGQLLHTHTNAHPYSMKQQNLPLTTANISVAQPVGIMRLETHQIGFGRFSILFLCSLGKKRIFETTRTSSWYLIKPAESRINN